MLFDPDTPSSTPTRRVPLTLISGMVTAAADQLAAAFRAMPGTAVVHHNLRQITHGVVRRLLQFGAHEETRVLELAHGCVSCTLREDLLPLLRTLAQRPEVTRIAVRLDEAMEPEPVCYAVQHVLVGDRPVSEFVDLDAVLTAIDLSSWLEEATGDATLADRGLIASPEDERTLAQVLISQVEFADVLIHESAAPDAWTAARTDAVLDRLAAGTPRIPLIGLDAESALASVPGTARRGELTDLHGRLLRGEPPLEADCGVSTLLYSDTRPFHPERLHEAIDILLDGVVRTRGRVWVASQPDAALWIESAGGGLGIVHVGPWLASSNGPGWDEVSPERAAMASLRWHPRFGDRHQELLVISHRASPVEIEHALDEALLTDDELAAGPEMWATYPDPFGAWHAEPCADTEVPDTRSSTHPHTDKDNP